MSDACRYLRWKGYRREATAESRADTFARNQVQYTCLHTGQPWGPTDEPAAPERCVCSRECFAAPMAKAKG